MKRPPHPTSTHPTLAALNRLIYDAFPPLWNGTAREGWWGYGRLYYLGDQRFPVRFVGMPQF